LRYSGSAILIANRLSRFVEIHRSQLRLWQAFVLDKSGMSALIFMGGLWAVLAGTDAIASTAGG
jgi:hypothetical protein